LELSWTLLGSERSLPSACAFVCQEPISLHLETYITFQASSCEWRNDESMRLKGVQSSSNSSSSNVLTTGVQVSHRRSPMLLARSPESATCSERDLHPLASVFVQSHHPEGAPVARVPRHARHKVPEGDVVTELTPGGIIDAPFGCS
jgi:hypothetical protein